MTCLNLFDDDFKQESRINKKHEFGGKNKLKKTLVFFLVSTTWTSARFSLHAYINGAIVFALITLARRHLRERSPAFNYLSRNHFYSVHCDPFWYLYFLILFMSSTTQSVNTCTHRVPIFIYMYVYIPVYSLFTRSGTMFF